MGAYTEGMGDDLSERLLGVSPEGVSENDIERALEERAEDEMRDGADEFRQWLLEHADINGAAGIALICTVVGGLRFSDRFGRMTHDEAVEDYRDRISDARAAVERDYIAYRTATASEAERDEIAASIRADRSEA